MLAALVAWIHKTEPPGDQVLEVLAACCIPQLLGQPQQMKNKIWIKSSQVYKRFTVYWYIIPPTTEYVYFCFAQQTLNKT